MHCKVFTYTETAVHTDSSGIPGIWGKEQSILESGRQYFNLAMWNQTTYLSH